MIYAQNTQFNNFNIQYFIYIGTPSSLFALKNVMVTKITISFTQVYQVYDKLQTIWDIWSSWVYRTYLNELLILLLNEGQVTIQTCVSYSLRVVTIGSMSIFKRALITYFTINYTNLCFIFSKEIWWFYKLRMIICLIWSVVYHKTINLAFCASPLKVKSIKKKGPNLIGATCLPMDCGFSELELSN
jgi:hypothetical protein